jgi:UDP-glucose-4-epimerase GalE
MSSTILVTGGAGYVGSHACKALRAAGYEPVTYDNLCRGHRWAVQWGPLEEGDLADSARLRAVIERHRPAAVMHFAALAYAGESVGAPLAYYHTNLAGTLSLLEVMHACGVRDLVFSSSCAVYGLCALPKIPETAPCNPVSPYGFSKLGMERMIADCGTAWGLRAVALRYFNAAGADPDGTLGEAHDPETHLIPLVLQAAAGERQHIDVFGDDYPTPDGTCVRDYIHVADLADAHVRALQRLPERGTSRAYNLGTGQGYSVKQVVDAARKIAGRPIRAEFRGRRAGDPPWAVAEATLAGRELGWQPRFTSIEPILESAWRWMQQGAAAAQARTSHLTARRT